MTIRSGIIIRMTFGTLIVSFVDNMIVLSPKGKSWIIWGLVMNAMKWSIWAVDTLILGVGAVSTGAPLPPSKQWLLASIKRYWDRSGIQCRSWFSVNLSGIMDRICRRVSQLSATQWHSASALIMVLSTELLVASSPLHCKVLCMTPEE